MSATRLSRDGDAPPVRLVHLGLGGFFRAHQAAYTDMARDAGGWGIAAFAGRSSTDLVQQLNDQGGLYTLVARGPDRDDDRVVASVTRAHLATDNEAWLGYFTSPDLAAVTVTVTEAGYLSGPDGHLVADDPRVQADVEAMRADRAATMQTAPGRLLAGLVARMGPGLPPVALVPCDNQSDNGLVLATVIADLAQHVDPGLARDLAPHLSVVTTMVDRITPRTEPADLAQVRHDTGRRDLCPVVTEPFSEWVLAGDFPAGRPSWDYVGATFVDDVAPYERRKLTLLNGGHSLLAYLGPLRGHRTVADAAADDICQEWLHQWWVEARTYLGRPGEQVTDYLTQLDERFANPRIRHRLDQIAADGSRKLPIRVVPTIRAARAAGSVPEAAARVLAGWLHHLRGDGVPVVDPDADKLTELAAGPLADSVARLLAVLGEDLAADRDLVAAVVQHYDALPHSS